MIKLNCPLCFPDEEETMSVLKSGNKEYHLAVLTNDGTKKWFHCEKCDGVYCLDKMKSKWQLSPATYTKFTESGLIEDRLTTEENL